MARNADLRKLWISSSLFLLPCPFSLWKQTTTIWPNCSGVTTRPELHFEHIYIYLMYSQKSCPCQPHRSRAVSLSAFSPHSPGGDAVTHPASGSPLPTHCLFEWFYCWSPVATFVTILFFFFFLWQPEVQFYKQMLLWASLTQLDQRQPFFQAAVSVLHTESEAALHRFLWIAGFLPETLDTLPTKQGVAH